jgi:predicted dehydrogenase|tara:strand:+ start:340 stop:1311 length:972 start_codon:yes stop_codon:yes gene_type:complete
MKSIGVVGLGVMGRRLINSVLQQGGMTVAAAWDPSEAARRDLRKDHPDIALLDSAAEVADSPRIDCLYVAGPPISHVPLAKLGLQAGKAVFCEKPLAVDLADSRSLVDLADRLGLANAVNFPFASSPATRWVAHRIATQKLGRLERLDIELAFSTWPRGWQSAAKGWLAGRKQGGLAREVLSHFIFQTQRLLGSLTINSVEVDYPDDGESAETGLRATLTAGEVAVRVAATVGMTAQMDVNGWILTGSQGAVRQHDWYSLDEGFNGAALQPVDFGSVPARDQTYLAQIDSLQAWLEERPHALPDFAEALAVQEIVEALLAQGA